MPEKPKYLPALRNPERDGVRKPLGQRLPGIPPDWPEWVREALFVCWVRCDQNMRAALVMLPEEWELYAEPQSDPETGELLELEPPEIPYQTAIAWKRRHNWEAKATSVIVAAYPQLNMNLAALLVHQRHSTTRYLIDVVNGRFPDAKHDHRIKAAEILIVASGAGTHGSKDRLAPVVREVASREVDLASMDEEQLAELQLKLVRDGKAQLPERRSS